MPKRAQYRVSWSQERASYLLSEAGRVDDGAMPADGAEWLRWLEEHRAFAFAGRRGRLNLLKEKRSRGGAGYWYAYLRRERRMLKHYVGRSEQLSLECLEELVILLSNEDQMASQAAAQAENVAAATVVEERQSEASKAIAHPIQFEPLLISKLQLPRLQKALLPRERLLDLLDRGLEHKLTVVAGPAGYGKTTLVGQWIAARTLRADAFHVAYVTLDGRDNDPIRFWRYIIAACQTFQPGFGVEALELLRAHRLPPFKSLDMMLTVFLNELSLLEHPAVLVLDDFHVLDSSSPVTDALSFVLEHLPAAFHLIILIRGHLPFSLTRLRAHNELLDIYPSQFAFNLEETRAFFEQELSFTLAPNVLRQICERLEGWPTGLRLLVREINSARGAQEIESLLTAFAGSHWSVRDYFLNEVLRTLPSALQEFVLQTCALPLISPALCDAILGRTDSTRQIGALHDGDLFLILGRTDSMQQIGALHDGDLFLIPLDGIGEWSRYHSLFAEAMQLEAQRRLGTVWLCQLAARASAWYEQHGFLLEAIETALNSTEWKRASDLIKQFIASKEQSLTPTVPEWYNLSRWLGRLPEDELELNPDLCLHYAMAQLFMLMEQANGIDGTERIYQLLQIAELHWRDAHDTAKLAEVFAFRALLARQEGRMLQAVTWARQSLAWLPANDRTWRNLSLTVVGIGELQDGNLNAGQDCLLEALTLCEQQGNVIYARATRGMLNWLTFERGELQRTAVQFRQMQAEAREQEDRDDISRTQMGLAMIEYEWNHLQEAELAAQEALMIGEQMHVEEVQARSLITLARIESKCGKAQQAQQRLMAWLARPQVSQTPHRYQYVREVQAALAQIQLADGNLRAVAQWFASIERDGKTIPLIQYQREQLIRQCLLLAQGEIPAALAGLADLQAAATRTGRVLFGLDVQVVQVLAYARQGSEVDARKQLYELLKVASKEGYLRLFLDQGEELITILRGLLVHLREKALITYARQIISAFACESGAQIQGRTSETMFFSEPLSPQEQKVLRLLVVGNSNAEIARELVVSVNTIRTQVQSIYRKLNVNSRVEASAVARQLALLG